MTYPDTTNHLLPAFPSQSIGPDFAPGYSGMTLRDYFAATAMNAFIQSPEREHFRFTEFAEASYDMADAMLKVREKGELPSNSC